MTFRAPADKWERNSGPVRATRALLESPDGQMHYGVRIKQDSSRVWMAMSEAAAVSMANEILDVIESREARK